MNELLIGDEERKECDVGEWMDSGDMKTELESTD